MAIGVEYVFTSEIFGTFQEATVVTDWIIDFESVLLAEVEVILAVAGSSVNCTGSGFEGDVITDHH